MAADLGGVGEGWAGAERDTTSRDGGSPLSRHGSRYYAESPRWLRAASWARPRASQATMQRNLSTYKLLQRRTRHLS